MASWHKAARLNWHHFEVKFLPGYSPDFNPIERLWLRLKADYSSDWIAHTSEELHRAPLHRPQRLYGRPPKGRLPVRHPEMNFGNRSS